MKQPNPITVSDFYSILWSYYDKHSRDLPWRHTTDPYRILISEIMLQQTQVPRVLPKYKQFLQLFPTVDDLAEAPLADVLRTWSGLGYNRRARYAWLAAQQVSSGGNFPRSHSELVALPGIGPNTAGAILAYAYNQPALFIETNVRTVVLHHFFADQAEVSDAEVRSTLEMLLATNTRSPRDFYWALMDYGTFLKTTTTNPGRRSKHYTKQSVFNGSKRQLRGQVLRSLGQKSSTFKELHELTADVRLREVLDDLLQDKLISKTGTRYHL